MTVEQLLNCSAEELKAMTNEQLLIYFKDVLKITRPEIANPEGKKMHNIRSQSFEQQTMNKLSGLKNKLKDLGLDDLL